MIITDTFYFIVGSIVFLIVFLLILKITSGKKRTFKSVGWLLFFAFVAALCSSQIINMPSKKIVCVKDSEEQTDKLEYRIFYAYGHPIIQMGNDIEVVTRDYGIKPFSNTIINFSSNSLVLYPIMYSDEGLFNLSQSSERKDWPDGMVINEGSYASVKRLPDFWFSNCPDKIEISEDPIASLWHSLFGGSEIRWRIVKEEDFLLEFNR